MPTGAVTMPETLGHGIYGMCNINASNEASTSMSNITPLFTVRFSTTRSLQLLSVLSFVSDRRQNHTTFDEARQLTGSRAVAGKMLPGTETDKQWVSRWVDAHEVDVV
jgi:hypothetical protein